MNTGFLKIYIQNCKNTGIRNYKNTENLKFSFGITIT